MEITGSKPTLFKEIGRLERGKIIKDRCGGRGKITPNHGKSANELSLEPTSKKKVRKREKPCEAVLGIIAEKGKGIWKAMHKNAFRALRQESFWEGQRKKREGGKLSKNASTGEKDGEVHQIFHSIFAVKISGK